jgi:polyisoprenoid-binding protein YceI
VSSSSARRPDGRIALKGTLSIHGTSRGVTVLVKVTDDGRRGTGTLDLKTSDFGIGPYSAFLGAVKVKDDVKLHLDLRTAD